MSFLTSEQPPDSLPEEVREYLTRIYTQIDIELSKTAALQVRTDFTGRPVVGKTYYFSNAAPSEPLITGEGFWGYTSAGWVLLG